jgi:ABC-type branched-subunit amino acid transport system substrate-binding protein
VLAPADTCGNLAPGGADAFDQVSHGLPWDRGGAIVPRAGPWVALASGRVVTKTEAQGRKMRRYRNTLTRLALSLLLLGASVFAMGSSGEASASEIQVCGDYALSGVYAQIGTEDNDGAIAYFKYIDSKGGILGHQVHYQYTDNQSSASQSALIARKCILQDHATWIMGPESGANTESALPIAISYKTILISMSSGWATNGYPTDELNSYGFPADWDVFAQDNIDMVKKVIVPRHYTKVALIEDNCGSVCLANKAVVEQLAKQYHFTLTTTQIVQLGQTDVTPQVLAMLATKPQVILFGLVPGTATITAIKSIRAQNPTIPLGECSQCYLPSFVAAAGGTKGMQNVFSIGSTANDYTYAKQHAASDPVAKATAAGYQTYFAGMKVAGYTSADVIGGAIGGWDGGLQMTWAIDQAKSLDDTADMHALQHLNTNTLGIQWDRTPQNYENYSQYYGSTILMGSKGAFAFYTG